MTNGLLNLPNTGMDLTTLQNLKHQMNKSGNRIGNFAGGIGNYAINSPGNLLFNDDSWFNQRKQRDREGWQDFKMKSNKFDDSFFNSPHNLINFLRPSWTNEYLNQPETIVDPNQAITPYEKPPATISFGGKTYPVKDPLGGTSYLGAGNPGTGDLRTVPNPNLPGGLVADAAFIGGNLSEGFYTTANLIGKFALDPIRSYVSGKKIVGPEFGGGGRWDTTYDATLPENVSKEVWSLSSMVQDAIQGDDKYEDLSSKNPEDRTAKENIDLDNYNEAKKNIFEAWKNFDITSLFPKRNPKSDDNKKDDNTSQKDINKIIAIGEDSTNKESSVVDASDKITKVLSGDKKEEGFWPSVTQGVNTFMDNLSDPKFQAALAMHMEAKDGGDVTDVLFAGVKSSQKSSAAMMQSHLNELKVREAELNLQKTTQDLSGADPATKTVTLMITGLLAPFDIKKNELSAISSVSARAMEYVKDGYSENQAVQLAMVDAKPALSEDKFWTGGAYNLLKLSPKRNYDPTKTTITVTTQEELDALASGTHFSYNGKSYIK